MGVPDSQGRYRRYSSTLAVLLCVLVWGPVVPVDGDGGDADLRAAGVVHSPGPVPAASGAEAPSAAPAAETAADASAAPAAAAPAVAPAASPASAPAPSEAPPPAVAPGPSPLQPHEPASSGAGGGDLGGVAFVAMANRGYVGQAMLAVHRARHLARREYPAAEAFLVGFVSRWTVEEKKLARDHGVKFLHVDPGDTVVRKLQDRGGKGAWPVECFLWLYVPRLLYQLGGFRYAVVLDGDMFAMDARILGELPRVAGLASLGMNPYVCHRARVGRTVTEMAEGLSGTPHGVAERNRTNSGIVVMNVERLHALGWGEWCEGVFSSAHLTFPGDQDLLDLCIMHTGAEHVQLDSRFNFRLTVPPSQKCWYDISEISEGMLSMAGSSRWDISELASFIHGTFAPKPWHKEGTDFQKGARHNAWAYSIQAEFVQLWRQYAVETLGKGTVAHFFGAHSAEPLSESDAGLRLLPQPNAASECRSRAGAGVEDTTRAFTTLHPGKLAADEAKAAGGWRCDPPVTGGVA